MVGDFPKSFRQMLASRYDVVGPISLTGDDPPASIISPDIARLIRALVVTAGTTITRRTIETLPALGLICCRGSGYDGVDVTTALEQGIAVTHAPGLSSSSVADIAMGLLIASVRKMTLGRRYIEQGEWKDGTIHDRLRVRGLTGRRFGIYGLGEIGRKIAQRAAAFEMEIAYHNRSPRADAPYLYFPSLLELARWADILMVSVRASSETHHSVNCNILAALGANGFIINVARGSVVNEIDLLKALSSGVISGAGLDVFEHEPVVPNPLLDMPSVALTPHMGADTDEVQEAALKLVLDNLAAFFDGRPLLNRVTYRC